MRRVRVRHVSVIAALLGVVFSIVTLMGCARQSALVALPSVNSTFVDVDGLQQAPGKVVATYPTEELSLGEDGQAGMPQFLDGTLYTFVYRNSGANEDIWTTAWDQATGKKLWSVRTNAAEYVAPYTTFVSDGQRLFFVSRDPSMNFKESIVCLDRTTGATLWNYALAHGACSSIAMRISEKLHTADRLYMIDGGSSGEASATSEVSFAGGVRTLNAGTGASLSYIDWPAFSQGGMRGDGQLLCDGATLYASIPESVYPVEKSSLVAFDLATNRQLWTASIDGDVIEGMVKEGNLLVVPRMFFSPANKNPQWWIDTWKTGTDLIQRLWTHQINASTVYGQNPREISLAADGIHVYLQDSKGVLMALDLATGKESWRQQFAPYKTNFTDGSMEDMKKLYDLYPDMTLRMTKSVLYVQDGGGLVVAIDSTTGDRLWEKRISQVTWHQTHTDNMFAFWPVDKGFMVVMSDGTVSLLQ
jgi:outer membrane protein assembly factor BamB